MRKWTAPIVLAAVVAAVTVAASADDGGIEEAIQELYAEIRSLDTSAGAVRLDEATRNKAVFVLDKLRQMIGRDPTTAVRDDRAFAAKTTTAAAAAGDNGQAWWKPQWRGKGTPDVTDDGGTGRPVESVRKTVVDRYERDDLHRVPVAVPPPSSPPSSQCPADAYADDLERRFHAAFRRYGTREKTAAAIRGTTVVCRPVRPNGRFSGFKMFNKKRVPSIAQ